MAIPTECQTPGAQFRTHISEVAATVSIEFGRKIIMSEHEARLLEANLHNAAELVFARYYTSDQTQQVPEITH
ncbi:MAG TPA: hypothetical protein VGI71_23920 [Scandinavium sp.]